MAGFVQIRQVESRPNFSFGQTLPITQDRPDNMYHPLGFWKKNCSLNNYDYF